MLRGPRRRPPGGRRRGGAAAGAPRGDRGRARGRRDRRPRDDRGGPPQDRGPPVTVAALGRLHAGRRRRHATALAGLVLALLAVAAVGLATGGYAIPVTDVIATLAGGGEGRQHFVVMEIRLPRLVLGALAGAALGMAGGIFQTLLGNPLASPDVIGVTAGASVAAVTALLVLGLTGAAIPLTAFAGGVLVAALVYVLAWRGGVAGERFVLVGVAVAFLANAVLGFLLTRSDVREAHTALVWLVGSVSGAGWDDIGVLAAALVALTPAAFVASRSLAPIQLGDDAAEALGVRTQPARLRLLGVGVALTAAGTAAAGPVAFVAFLSGPIARRLTGTAGAALAASALVGALVVTLADLVALRLLPGGMQVPVGVVTGAAGAPYLLWLLATEGRRRSPA
ncbi:MAG: iron chelate uptake ABC transporter family permease subunit [Thermoleophilia bacterium]|nr:iron chelate uptake ABC transporter family permease subunit [Thermoleophilia bacterium]